MYFTFKGNLPTLCHDGSVNFENDKVHIIIAHTVVVLNVLLCVTLVLTCYPLGDQSFVKNNDHDLLSNKSHKRDIKSIPAQITMVNSYYSG
jgi:hypothetical protein